MALLLYSWKILIGVKLLRFGNFELLTEVKRSMCARVYICESMKIGFYNKTHGVYNCYFKDFAIPAVDIVLSSLCGTFKLCIVHCVSLLEVKYAEFILVFMPLEVVIMENQRSEL